MRSTYRAFATTIYYVLCALVWLALIPFLLYLSFKPKYRHTIPYRFFPFLYPPFPYAHTSHHHTHPYIWFHACSFGEVKSLEPLVLPLLQRLPSDKSILITTTTHTGYELATRTYNAHSVLVSYLPFECFLPFYKRHLTHLHSLVVTEAELWLGLFHTAHSLNARTFLINARISSHSYPKYRRFAFFYRLLFSYVDMIFSQSSNDNLRLMSLGALNIRVLGNLKLLSPIAPSHIYSKPKRLVIVGASTHRGEEEIILQAFCNLLDSRINLNINANATTSTNSTSTTINANNTHITINTSENNPSLYTSSHVNHHTSSTPSAYAYPLASSHNTHHVKNALLILAPRHPERFTEVKELLQTTSLSTTSFTQASTLAHQLEYTQVLLLDTLGALNDFYAIADIVILGGAFIKAGGHNPLEPAFFGVKLISGVHIFHQEALFECIDGYTLCDEKHLTSLLCAYEALPNARYKPMKISLEALLDMILHT